MVVVGGACSSSSNRYTHCGGSTCGHCRVCKINARFSGSNRNINRVMVSRSNYNVVVVVTVVSKVWSGHS